MTILVPEPHLRTTIYGWYILNQSTIFMAYNTVYMYVQVHFHLVLHGIIKDLDEL